MRLQAQFHSKKHPARQVAEVVADYYQISIDCLYSSNRTDECSKARHLAFYICREDLKMSYPQIGKIFNRDHTTVLLGCRAVSEKPTWWEKVLGDVRRLLVKDPPAAAHCDHCGQELDAEVRAKRQAVELLSGAAAALEKGIEAAGGRK